MRPLDWVVLGGSLAFIVVYGVWKGRGSQSLKSYLLADRSFRWPTVALSIMATQASAITFLSTPGQAYADGMRFVQFYFGLPLAMIVLSIVALPAYRRLQVFTAYEYLERRFDGKTRSLAAFLFLVQRGLAAGLTIYAPALVLSVLLGWNLYWTNLVIGVLVITYTSVGGARAVSQTHVHQFLIIFGGMTLAFFLILKALPEGVGFTDAVGVAGVLGRLNAVEWSTDLNDRYTIWSGLIGGFFLQMSYFGTDQSQVGRYLTGRSVAHSRMSLLFNGLFKVPMQFAILFLGAMVFVFYQFVIPPVFFNPAEVHKVRSGAHAAAYADVEARHAEVFEHKGERIRAYVDARRAGDEAAAASSAAEVRAADADMRALKREAVALIQAEDPAAQTSDTNYIFLTFVLNHLPVGVVGLVLAAIFAASMSSTAAELNALASTTVVDVYRRFRGRRRDGDLPAGERDARDDDTPAGEHASREPNGARAADRTPASAADPLAARDRHEVRVSRAATVLWGGFAITFAMFAGYLGTLIEAINILGSLVYGTILGIFMTAFLFKRVGGNAVFAGALVAEVAVVCCFLFTGLSFLWYNVVGCLGVILIAHLLQPIMGRRPAGAGGT